MASLANQCISWRQWLHQRAALPDAWRCGSASCHIIASVAALSECGRRPARHASQSCGPAAVRLTMSLKGVSYLATNSLIWAGLPGSWAPNWLQGNSRISRPSEEYFFCSWASSCGGGEVGG